MTSVAPSTGVVSSDLGNVRDQKIYKTRFFYNSRVVPSNVDASLARKRHKYDVLSSNIVRSCVFSKTAQPAGNTSLKAGSFMYHVTHNDFSHPNAHSSIGVGDLETAENSAHNPAALEGPGFESSGPGFESGMAGYKVTEHKTKQSTSGHMSREPVIANPTGHGFESFQVSHCDSSMNQEGKSLCEQDSYFVDNPDMTSPKISGPGVDSSVNNDINTSCLTSVNIVVDKANQLCPIYDVNNVGMEDKFVNTIIFVNQGNKALAQGVNIPIFNQWKQQVDFQFGFVPLGSQLMPSNAKLCNPHDYSPIQMHQIVKKTGKPNFLQARLPVASQLHVDKWKSLLKDYWDQQLLQLLQFGFPLDFNRCCPLQHESGNHSSANEFPADVDAYIEEECKFGALLGPFDVNPIENAHNSPFMTRNKPNSDRRRVIIDLSWPLGASVNSGIDKNTYLDAPFTLTFPTVDDITSELKRIGRGALLYKIDVSRAFRHVKVDPGDNDLLGLHWRHAYVDTCVPFGTRHGSQIFQRLSDAVRHIMRQKGFRVIDYIDDYVGFGVPSVVCVVV